ncbi:hypothetical protein Hdeb2414_s0009g00312781 [Helianthus debilis subsp. tardiflorus]
MPYLGQFSAFCHVSIITPLKKCITINAHFIPYFTFYFFSLGIILKMSLPLYDYITPKIWC